MKTTESIQVPQNPLIMYCQLSLSSGKGFLTPSKPLQSNQMFFLMATLQYPNIDQFISSFFETTCNFLIQICSVTLPSSAVVLTSFSFHFHFQTSRYFTLPLHSKTCFHMLTDSTIIQSVVQTIQEWSNNLLFLALLFFAVPREAHNPNLDSDQRIASYVRAPRL